MLKIQRRYIEQVHAATEPADLHGLLQEAVRLEHSTIPPYLCAYFTLKLGTNQEVAHIIRSVVLEEMLHMSIAANLLIAIGGRPAINAPHFIPAYPGPLPMHIGDLTVPLARCTVELIRDVFMRIEEPEHPLPIRAEAGVPLEEFATIGAFYEALDRKLQELGPSAFRGDFSLEMLDTRWFAPGELFKIKDPESASAAIKLIVKQGEGTAQSPLDPENEPAHFYRFQQIPKGRLLVRNPNVPIGYSYSGTPVVLDTANVWNMAPNPEPDALPPGSTARRVSLLFAYAYTTLLNALHEAFNGDPDGLDRSIGLMYQLRLLAQDVLSTPLPGSSDPTVCTGLPFRYQPTTD